MSATNAYVSREAVITVKKNTFDPAGKTVLDFLARQGGYTKISSLTVGTFVSIRVAKQPEVALKDTVETICDKAGLKPITNDIQVQLPGWINNGKDEVPGVYDVDAIIRPLTQIGSPHDLALLRQVRSKGYEGVVESLEVAKLVRMEVAADSKADALEYVLEFSNRRGLYNPVIEALELR